MLEINVPLVRTEKHAKTLETVKHQYNTNITGLIAHTVIKYGTQSCYAVLSISSTWEVINSDSVVNLK